MKDLMYPRLRDLKLSMYYCGYQMFMQLKCQDVRAPRIPKMLRVHGTILSATDNMAPPRTLQCIGHPTQ